MTTASAEPSQEKPQPEPFGNSETKPNRGVPEIVYYIGFGGIVLLLASLPQIIGLFSTPPKYVFTGFSFNADDGAVYLSWMRQAQEGHFFLLNRFTTEPQRGILFNLFFFLLGRFSRLSGLDLPTVYQIARVCCGIAFLAAVVHLLRVVFPQRERTRWTAFAFVALASGIGWFWQDYDATKGIRQPVDLWQPEAVPFLALYFTPLFTAALACMTLFVAAFLRSEQNGKIRSLWPCFLTGFLLGNFHTYDVVSLFSTVAAYRVITDILNRRIDRAGWIRILLIGVAMLPTTAYVAYALRTESVFYERAFVSNTLSPEIWWIAAGFGLPLLLAVAEAIRRKAEFKTDSALRLLLIWAVLGIVVAYLPVSFQRKMLMGAFVPIALLASSVLTTFSWRLSGDYPKIVLGVGIALCTPSNGLFLLRDVERLTHNIGSTEHRPFLSQGEADALSWLGVNGKAGDVVLCAPDPASHRRFPAFPLRPYLSVWIPVWSSCTVYDGHWSETAHFPAKMQAAIAFFEAKNNDDTRRVFLSENRIRYLLVPNALMTEPVKDVMGGVFYSPVIWRPNTLPPYLSQAYQNDTVTIYAVNSP